MANKRIRLKRLKQLERLALEAKIKELERINKEIMDIDREIENAKRILKQKKSTFSQLKSSVESLSQISIRAQELALSATQSEKNKTLSEMPDSAKAYVAIKKYHDYVNKGVIKEQSILDKYLIQDFMERIMSQDEYDDYIEESIKKGEDLLKKDEARRMKANNNWGYSF